MHPHRWASLWEELPTQGTRLREKRLKCTSIFLHRTIPDCIYTCFFIQNINKKIQPLQMRGKKKQKIQETHLIPKGLAQQAIALRGRQHCNSVVFSRQTLDFWCGPHSEAWAQPALISPCPAGAQHLSPWTQQLIIKACCPTNSRISVRLSYLGSLSTCT